MRIEVGIATIGRTAILCETSAKLSRQSCLAGRLIVCATLPQGVAGVAAAEANLLLTASGLPRKHDAITNADVVIFFDDDLLLDPGYLVATIRHMPQAPETVIVTDMALADSIVDAGLTPEAGRAILAAHAGVQAVFNRTAAVLQCGWRQSVRKTSASMSGCASMAC